MADNPSTDPRLTDGMRLEEDGGEQVVEDRAEAVLGLRRQAVERHHRGDVEERQAEDRYLAGADAASGSRGGCRGLGSGIVGGHVGLREIGKAQPSRAAVIAGASRTGAEGFEVLAAPPVRAAPFS